MYCGICVEVCPFDALFWSPEFEYSEPRIADLLHDKDRLGEWMETVPDFEPYEAGSERGQEGPRRCTRAMIAAAVAQNIFFYVIAAVMVFAAFRVVTTKNVVHAAVYLVIVLAGVGAQFILLAAEFVAVTQVLVYIGAVVVLVLFGIMLTRAKLGRDVDLTHDYWFVGAITSVSAVRGHGVRAARRIRLDEPLTGPTPASEARATPRRSPTPSSASTWCRSRSSRCSCSPRSSGAIVWRGRTDGGI